MKMKEDLILRNIAGQYVIVPMGERLAEFNGMITVKGSGVLICKLLENEATKEDIVEAMLEEYDIDKDTAVKDVDSFINWLIDANLLEA